MAHAVTVLDHTIVTTEVQAHFCYMCISAVLMCIGGAQAPPLHMELDLPRIYYKRVTCLHPT
jgi:hypothetical protein